MITAENDNNNDNNTDNIVKIDNGGGGFIKSAALLTVGGIIAKILGAVYRIPLTNMLGSYGIGIYQLIFPLYGLLITLASAGIPTAVSKIVAERTQLGDYDGAKRYFKAALVLLSGIGFVCAVFLFVCAELLSKALSAPETATAYRIVAASIFAECVSAAFKGWFHGTMNMKPSAFSQIIEQGVKLGVGLCAVALSLPDVNKAVYAAVLAVTVSEVSGLIVMAIAFLRSQRKENNLLHGTQGRDNDLLHKNKVQKNNSLRSNQVQVDSSLHRSKAGERQSLHSNDFRQNKSLHSSQLQKNNSTQISRGQESKSLLEGKNNAELRECLKILVRTALPLTLSAIVVPVSHLVDSIMVQNLITLSNRTELYGLWSGPVHSLITMPAVLTAGIAASVVPGMARSCAVGDKKGITEKLNTSMSLSIAISLPAAVGLAMLAPEVGRLLYPNLSSYDAEVFVKLLQLAAASIVFTAVMMTGNSVLQANGSLYVPVIGMAAGTAVKCVMDFFLYRNVDFHIFGEGISGCACYFIACVVNLWYIRRRLGLVIRWSDVCIKPLIAVTAMSCGIVTLRFAFPVIFSTGMGSLAAIAFAGAIYLFSLGIMWRKEIVAFIRKRFVRKKKTLLQ